MFSNINTMKSTNKIKIFAQSLVLMLVASSCDPLMDSCYTLSNNSSETLHITVYPSAAENACITDKQKPLCSGTVGSKSDLDLFLSTDFVGDIRVFLSMADSCIVRLDDSCGAVVKKWYRNYDLSTSSKEFFDKSYWTEKKENGILSINDNDLELINQ